MTKEFIRNHYADFKVMFSKFKEYEISAYNSGKCGMHCNLSNALFGKTPEKQLDNIAKFTYFVNKHFNEMCEMVRRDRGSTRYCSQMYAPNYTYIRENLELEEYQSSHGICMNTAHFEKGRVEFRLVGGQQSYASFRNTMEVIFFMIERINKCSIATLDDFCEFFKGCNQNVLDRLSRLVERGYITNEKYTMLSQSATPESFN